MELEVATQLCKGNFFKNVVFPLWIETLKWVAEDPDAQLWASAEPSLPHFLEKPAASVHE